MPTEPPTSSFASKVHQTAYKAVEKGGIIWVYMGPPEYAAEIPDFEWLRVPEGQRAVSKRMQDCNWLQNLEGEVDSSHAPFLHGSVGPEGILAYNGNEDRHPIFTVLDTDFGVAIAARREAGPEQYYWRVTPFMLPSYTIVPRARETNYIFTAAIPVDDTNMIGITVVWSPDKDVPQTPVVEVDENYRSIRNKDNDYLIDRELQKTKSFTGITGVRVQDMAVQEDQRGPVSDRTTEHLGTADLGVISARRRLIAAARALENGEEPKEPLTPQAFNLRSLALKADRSIPWADLMKEYMLLGEPGSGQREASGVK